jgi:hypothetical protein
LTHFVNAQLTHDRAIIVYGSWYRRAPQRATSSELLSSLVKFITEEIIPCRNRDLPRPWAFPVSASDRRSLTFLPRE